MIRKKRLYHDEVMTPSRHQCGFTLVELMISLLIGLVIVLGATQLFMVSRQSFEDVKALGMKQNALNYSVDVLSRDIRRATSVELGGENGDDKHRLCIKIENADAPDEHMEYYLERTDPSDDKSADYSLKKKSRCDVDDSGGETSVLVNGFAEDGLTVTELGTPDGLLKLILGFVEGNDNAKKITFRVMNRMSALSASGNKPGYDSEGNKLHPSSCYRGGEFDPDKSGCPI